MEGGERDNREQGERQIGPLLEKKRMEKGLSLKDVEQATKIRTRYLQGLEREDFSMLPDHIYTRGFLKTYANFLGLDGEKLSRELKERRSPRRERQFNYEEPLANRFERPFMSSLGGIGAEPRRISGAAIFTFALALLVLTAVVGALYYVGTRSQPSENTENQSEGPASAQDEEAADEPAEEEPAVAAETVQPATQSVNESTTASRNTVQITVAVQDLPAGLTVTADGSVVLDQFAQPGFYQAFEAQRVLSVSTSNAGSVEVELDGQNMGRLGNVGQPVTREFPVDP
jgi:cytoskeleton protein RodZ